MLISIEIIVTSKINVKIIEVKEVIIIVNLIINIAITKAITNLLKTRLIQLF